MKLRCKLFGLVLLVSAAQADSMTTIRLQNRPAVEVIPIIQPMLGADDAISGQGYKIFLRSSPATLAQVKDLVSELDIAAKTLQVSVFQGNVRDLGALDIGANIRIEAGDANVSLGSGRDTSGAGGGITFGTNRGSGSISGSSTRRRLQESPIHQVRVTEGAAAYIETGEQIPFFSGAGWILSESVAGGIDYKKVTTGFYVLPRIHGDMVTLQVSPFRNSLSSARGGNIETQSASTTLTGRIGEWLLIGGVTEQLKRAQSGTGSYHSTQSRNNKSIWIKADLVR